MIEFDDFIFVDSWEKLAKKVNSPHLIYSPLESIHDIFNSLAQFPDEKFVVLSGYSDYGVCYQQEFPVNADFYKLTQFVPYEKIAAIRDRYYDFHLPAASYERCDIKHKYAIRMYAYTNFTFDELPPNLVAWYCPNVGVEHPRIHCIPFGVNNDGPGSSYIPKYAGAEKKYWLYVNFQRNTMERVGLKRFFKLKAEEAEQEMSGQRIFKVSDEPNLPVEQYLQEVSSSHFVLSPRGNGFDCYRNLEALYLGSIPILEDSVFARNYIEWGLPVVLVNDFRTITPEILFSIKKDYLNNSFSLEKIKLSYWTDTILKTLKKSLDL